LQKLQHLLPVNVQVVKYNLNNAHEVN
jgi:hypothetical protein